MPGDAKALSVVDFDGDGWPDFLVSRNNSTSLAFGTQARREGAPLKLSLKGPPGNPTGIGSLITVTLRNGSTRTLEVSSAVGRYSQSTAGGFVGYVTDNPPIKIRVRWPAGTVTETPASLSKSVLEITA